MSETIVSKAGGTSNADAAAVEQSLGWAEESAIFVVSAPGKLHGEGPAYDKVTDNLLGAHAAYIATGEVPNVYTDAVTERYASIVKGLDGSSLSGKWTDKIPGRIEEAARQGEDAASMLGERLQAEIYESLGFTLLDPARSPHSLGSESWAWQSWLSGGLGSGVAQEGKRYVLPGNTTFIDGQLVTFSRGGSDTSGGLAAYGIDADLHRNLTDHGALSANPKDIPHDRLRHVEHLLYEEGRELGRNGTGLLHPAAMVPLMQGRIPTEIRSTFDRKAPVTFLDNDIERAIRRSGRVTALSLMENVTIHRVHEPGMAEAIGRLAAFEGALAERGIPLIDAQGDGVDGQKYFVSSGDASRAKEAFQETTNGTVETSENLTLLTMVGYRLETQLLSNIVRLALTSRIDADAWQSQGHDFSIGRHSLRMSVRPEEAKDLLQDLHAAFIESRDVRYWYGDGVSSLL